MNKSFFGVIGLGVMGKSLSLNIAEKGFSLSVYNINEAGEEEIVKNFIDDNQGFRNIQGYSHLPEFVKSLEQPRKILLMIKAGKTIDLVIDQLIPLLDKNDILIGITTSGNSLNILKVLKYARSKKISTLGFLGSSGGKCKNFCDIKLMVPSDNTARIQECHIFLAHFILQSAEDLLIK